MSSLIRQSHASNSQPLWASASGSGAPTVVDTTQVNLLTSTGAPTNADITTDGTTNGIMCLQGDIIRFTKSGSSLGNTALTTSANGANLDSLVCGGQISATGTPGSRGMALFNAKYLSCYDATTPTNIEAMRIGSGTTGTPGVTFSEIEVQAGSTLYFNQIGQAANSYITPAPFNSTDPTDIFNVGGSIFTRRLNFVNTTGFEVFGTATLVAGTIVVNTGSSDVNSIILLTRGAVNASTTLGELRVSNKGANNFTIVSAQTGAPTSTQTGDLSDVQWVILNPA